MKSILDRITDLQHAAELAKEKALDARDIGDWNTALYHTFQIGRITQSLHSLKDKHRLDFYIPEPAEPVTLEG